MPSKFDIDICLDKIKSALYDIYENQDIVIGAIDDEKQRDNQVSKYIEIKNDALSLIDKIENIYGKEKTEPRIIESSNGDNSNKLYLDYKNGKRTLYAYVSKNIFNKLKNNFLVNQNPEKIQDEDKSIENYEPEEIINTLYKDDQLKPKGIIVRTDQYMKLSLSRHRQAGILREAKYSRIKEAKLSREKLNFI